MKSYERTTQKGDHMTPKKTSNKDVIVIDNKFTKAERLENYKKKLQEIDCDFSYKSGNSTKKIKHIIPEFKNEETAREQKSIEHATTICAATGSASYEFGLMLFTTTISGFFMDDSSLGIFNESFNANAVRDALLAMKPADEYEGMLCSRLLVLHNQYMHFMARITGSEQTSQSIDLNINRATKLMRLYNETLESLNKYRRKGEQKVTVQHVNVNSGGQAVVAGSFQQGGEGSDKN